MQLIVNGNEMQFDKPLNLSRLLAQTGFQDKRVAVMVNEKIIRRDDRDQCVLAEGDRVEIISMVGGG